MKTLLCLLALWLLLAIAAVAQTAPEPREQFVVAQISRPHVRLSTDVERERGDHEGDTTKAAWLQVALEALRSITFWLTLLVTALVAYFAAYLIAHSGYRSQAPQMAPRVARTAIGWGLMLSVLLPMAAAWRLEWPWIWAALLGTPFFCLGGLALLTNSR